MSESAIVSPGDAASGSARPRPYMSNRRSNATAKAPFPEFVNVYEKLSSALKSADPLMIARCCEPGAIT